MNEFTIHQYIVDAFTDHVFFGNPAAVCILEQPLPDSLMSDIARENNLSETAFILKKENLYTLRWFTPGGEIDLCGHATLASAFILLNFYETGQTSVTFSTISGNLTVTRRKEFYEMDFPAYELTRIPVTSEMANALGAVPREAWSGRDLVCVFDDASAVRTLTPDFEKVKELEGLLLHATAPYDEDAYDCISRSFAPKLNVLEDPVCGSGHCHIIPYWTEKLGKTSLTAYQASERSGVLYCRTEDDRVILAGKAALYSHGQIHIPETSLISIDPFQDKYTQDVIDLVLHFQNDGTRPPVSVDDQPDLLDITGEYIEKGGNFWIAARHGTLIGSIGIMPYTPEIAVLKKFFVYEDYQGEPYHIGQKLYQRLLTFAREKGFKTILLDTPYNTDRAHAFYEKAGFRKVTEDQLPIRFSHPYKDCDFFLLEL